MTNAPGTTWARRWALPLACVTLAGWGPATPALAQYDICAQTPASLRLSRDLEVRNEVQRAQAQINAAARRAMDARMQQEEQARRAFNAEMADITARRAQRAREGLKARARNTLTPFEERQARQKLADALKAIRGHWRNTIKTERSQIREDSEQRIETIRLAYRGSIANRRRAACR